MALLCSVIFTVLVGLGQSVTPISDDSMTDLLNAGGVQLAMAAQPLWFFGQSQQPRCCPTWATWGGQQNPGGEPCNFPNVGCNCRNPGISIRNPSRELTGQGGDKIASIFLLPLETPALAALTRLYRKPPAPQFEDFKGREAGIARVKCNSKTL